MSEFNLQDAQGVLEWARDLRDCERNVYIRDEQMEEIAEVIRPQLHGIAQAMRQAAVWKAHRDKLARFCAMSEGTGRMQYSTINRHTLAKAIRALLSDMDAAREEKDG